MGSEEELQRAYETLRADYQNLKAERDHLYEAPLLRLGRRVKNSPVLGQIARPVWTWTQHLLAHPRAQAPLADLVLTPDSLAKLGAFKPSPRYPNANRDGLFGTPMQRKAILVCNSAYRAGGPLIGLTLLRELSARMDCEFFVFFVENAGIKGQLLDEFAALAHTFVNTSSAQFRAPRTLRTLVERMAPPGPSFVLTNGADCVTFIPQLAALELPVLTLVHEYVDATALTTGLSTEHVTRALLAAERVVFPSHFVAKIGKRMAPALGERSCVVPQGLLKPAIAARDKAASRVVLRKRLGLPDDAFVVLGCGSIDARKGADLFMYVALRVLRRATSDDIYFVWLGSENQYSGEVAHWMRRAAPYIPADRIRYVGAHPDVEDFFVGCDTFLVTSREDPFPCVVHEAMAARVPVATFADNGGAAESLADGCGVVVPYLDVAEMAEHVCAVHRDRGAFAPMVERAFRKVRDEYDFTAYAQRIQALLETECLKEPRQ